MGGAVIIKGIRNWLTSLYVVLAILPLIVLGMAMSAMVGSFQLEQSRELQRELAKRVQAEIEIVPHKLKSILLGQIRINDPLSMGDKERYELISKLRSSIKDQEHGDVLNRLVLVDASGRQLAKATRISVEPAESLTAWDEEAAFRVPVSQDIPYYSSVYLDETSMEPLITASYPIRDIRSGTVQGVLVSEMRLKYVWNAIEDLSADLGGIVYIVDQNGRVVVHPNSSIVLADKVFDPGQGNGLSRGLGGEWGYIATQDVRLGTQTLRLVIERPALKALSLPVMTGALTALFFIVSIMSISFLWRSVFRRIVTPVESLANAARELASGDLSVRVNKYRPDEIGSLAESFNLMADYLEDTISSLQQQISERVATEKALESEKERLSVTLRSIGDGVIVTDLSSKIIIMNRASEALTGWRQEDAIGHDLKSVYQVTYMQWAGGKGENKFNRYILRARDGRNSYISERIAPIKNSAGDLLGRIIVFRDVSDEIEFENYISRQNEYLGSLLESLTHPFYVIDVRTRIVKLANSAAGFGELTGKATCHALTHGRNTPCEGREHACTIRAVLRKNGPVTLEHVHYKSDGTPMYIELHGYPIYDKGSGAIVEVVEYTIDITERKAQERKLLRASSLEAIGKLAAGVAHEINTPLTNASLGIEMVMSSLDGRDNVQKQAMGRLESIERNIDKASKIAQELLWFSRQKEPEMDSVNLKAVIEGALVMSEWNLKNIEVSTRLCSSAFIKGDHMKLEQVFINLLSNAAEAMPEGGALHISCEATDYKALIEIADSGMGISDDAIVKVFEPFYTTKPGRSGTGLGLAICYEIVKQHYGDISVSSQQGKGTTVTIELPIDTRHE